LDGKSGAFAVKLQSASGYLDLSAIGVLVLDDNLNTQSLIAEVLRSLGVSKIHRSQSAHSARMILQAGGIDLVFADIEMVGENGLEFVHKLRASQDPRLANVVVVMVSAHATESRVIEAGAVGANSFLVKPFSVASFAKRLAEGFANRKAALEAAARRPPDHWPIPTAKAVEI
jgi:hypothetical protein